MPSSAHASVMHFAHALSIAVAIVLVAASVIEPADAAESERHPLTLEATIQLDGVNGRIDHLTVDLEGRRLFVAELGNGSVDIIDMGTRSVTKRISGLDEPQGVAYSNRTRLL